MAAKTVKQAGGSGGGAGGTGALGLNKTRLKLGSRALFPLLQSLSQMSYVTLYVQFLNLNRVHLKTPNNQIYGFNLSIIIIHACTGCFFNWYPPKKLKYGNPRLGVSTLTYIGLDTPNLA